MDPPAVPAPEDPGRDPEGEERPRWPLWYVPVAFLGALSLTLLGAGIVAGVADVAGIRDRSALGVAQTLAQDAALVLVAVGLAAQTARPRLWHFGLGRAPLGRLLAVSGIGYVAFIAAGQLYQRVFDPEGEQRIVERLGADDSVAAFVAIGVLVIVLAPIVEELFFRGFVFRALRGRLSFPVAALIDGAVFGAVHYTGSETLSILPVFVLLGIIFCWTVERTGSLYPAIAMHAFNNALAYGALTRGTDLIPAAIATVALAAVVTAARLAPAGGPGAAHA